MVEARSQSASKAGVRARPRGTSAAALFQRRDRGQGLALEELEERTTAGGDVRHVAGDAVLVDRGQGVATAGDRERLRTGDRACQCLRPLAERVAREHADRAVT